VNWAERRIVMFNPYFTDQVQRGSKLAIGDPDFWRIVRLGQVRERYVFDFVQYEFREVG